MDGAGLIVVVVVAVVGLIVVAGGVVVVGCVGSGIGVSNCGSGPCDGVGLVEAVVVADDVEDAPFVGVGDAVVAAPDDNLSRPFLPIA